MNGETPMTDKTRAKPNGRWHPQEQVRKTPRYTQAEIAGFKHEQPGWRNGARVRK